MSPFCGCLLVKANNDYELNKQLTYCRASHSDLCARCYSNNDYETTTTNVTNKSKVSQRTWSIKSVFTLSGGTSRLTSIMIICWSLKNCRSQPVVTASTNIYVKAQLVSEDCALKEQTVLSSPKKDISSYL